MTGSLGLQGVELGSECTESGASHDRGGAQECAEVLAQVAHDLRTPLHAISGYAELLVDEVTLTGVGYLEQLVEAVTQIDRIVTQLLGN
jgi:K+-sensing histidine kinase KdpD